jgi:hypothetical protein
MDIVKKLRARQAYPLDGAGQLINPDGPEAADYIEQLRKENQTQALDFLASEGEWWELIGKKDKEIERLRKEIHEYDDMIRDAGWYLTDDGGNSYKNADEIISHFLLAKDKARAEHNAALKEVE